MYINHVLVAFDGFVMLTIAVFYNKKVFDYKFMALGALFHAAMLTKDDLQNEGLDALPAFLAVFLIMIFNQILTCELLYYVVSGLRHPNTEQLTRQKFLVGLNSMTSVYLSFLFVKFLILIRVVPSFSYFFSIQ